MVHNTTINKLGNKFREYMTETEGVFSELIQEYEILESENSDFEDEIDDLKNDISNLREINNNLIEQLDSAESQIEDLKGTIA